MYTCNLNPTGDVSCVLYVDLLRVTVHYTEAQEALVTAALREIRQVLCKAQSIRPLKSKREPAAEFWRSSVHLIAFAVIESDV